MIHMQFQGSHQHTSNTHRISIQFSFKPSKDVSIDCNEIYLLKCAGSSQYKRGTIKNNTKEPWIHCQVLHLERTVGKHCNCTECLEWQLFSYDYCDFLSKLTRYHCFVNKGSFMLMSMSLMSLYPLFLLMKPSCCTAFLTWKS